jgi:hypothetical protein
VILSQGLGEIVAILVSGTVVEAIDGSKTEWDGLYKLSDTVYRYNPSNERGGTNYVLTVEGPGKVTVQEWIRP